jgi:hypothetical protein
MKTPAGFAPVFPGWNVWDVWQASDPSFDLMNLGLALERQAQIWIEDKLKDEAPGVAVADPANPLALRGDQIQIIPAATGLERAVLRAEVPGLEGAQQVGATGTPAIRRTVRFYNRGASAVLPWPHDGDYLLETVYQPSATNPITSGAAPSSLAGAASAVGDVAADTAKIVGLVLGLAVLGLVLSRSK